MKEKNKSAISIIGGADGSTSIFVAGRTGKMPLKVRIRNAIYRFRSRRAERKVVAGTHTLDELVQYARNRYNLMEIDATERKYIEQRKNLKESLILQHKPEILGEMPDHVIPMNFHLYEIRIGKDSLEIAIEYNWNILGISYSGKRKVMKQFKKISKDLYRYYGVSEDDIKRKTERYSSLIMALSS